MTMTPLPHAEESFIHELSVSLTERQNTALWDILRDATMNVIRLREFLTALPEGNGNVVTFLEYCDVSNEQNEIRECLTAAVRKNF